MADSSPLALWVSPVANLAGVARHILDVARVGLPGWRLAVCAPQGPLLDRLRCLGCQVVPLNIDELSPPEAVVALRRQIKELRPAVVHSHLAKADILIALATVGLPVKLITTEHHIAPDRFMFHPTLASAITMETVHRLRLRRFAQAIAVSASTKRDMLRYWHTRTPITVIRNGVDRQPALRTVAPGLRFLSLTRLAPEKNVAATVRAFALIATEHPDARLTIAGSGDQYDSLVRQVSELGLAARVDFPGFVEPSDAMKSHDVIMQPSMSDNCSYTLLDAVAQGLGVAASPIGGNPEILPPRCIADFGDDQGLAQVAIEQAQQPAQRPQLPAVVPTVAEMADRICSVYRAAFVPGPSVLRSKP